MSLVQFLVVGLPSRSLLRCGSRPDACVFNGKLLVGWATIGNCSEQTESTCRRHLGSIWQLSLTGSLARRGNNAISRPVCPAHREDSLTKRSASVTHPKLPENRWAFLESQTSSRRRLSGKVWRSIVVLVHRHFRAAGEEDAAGGRPA